MECIRVQMGQTEAQRGHTAQLVDFCYLLYNTLLKSGRMNKKKVRIREIFGDNAMQEMFVCVLP